MRLFVVALAGLVAAAVMPAAQAATSLVTNGDFEQTSFTYPGYSQQWNNAAGSQVTGWTNATTTGYTGYGYNFLIHAGAADTAGFYSLGGNHDYLWGPGGGASSANYSNNGLTAASPTGGNYILADGDSNFHGGISQTISGLTAGTNYLLTFNWATAEFAGYNMQTTDRWDVTFGNSTQSTATRTTAAKGFDPWTQASMMFTATSATQTLTFLAQGSPNNAPPSLLLDSVSMSAVPEPTTWAAMVAGLGLVGWTMRRRRRAPVVA